jgi:hypothetical protein
MFRRLAPKLITVLQRAEVQLSARVATISPRRHIECVDLRALKCELQSYEKVDEVCAQVAAVLTEWYRTKFSPEPLVVADRFCEPVLFRVRDATRLLIECGGIPPEFSKKEDALIHELLVARWHSYAERYWRQRWLKGNMGESAGAM